MELSGNSPENFDGLVDLIVKEQFIKACSKDLAMYLLERGPNGLVELTTWAQKCLIVHKHQPGGKSKATVQTAMHIRRNRHNPNQIRHKDARGCYSDSVVKVLDIGNQSVVSQSR